MKISIEEFNKIIPTIYSKETSSHPDLWSKENPAYGHCAIVSPLAQEYFGGEIVKVSLKGTRFENLRSHFFNIIDGEEMDFTISQFEGSVPYVNVSREPASAEEMLSYPDTKRRFDLLKQRFLKILS